MMTTRWRDAFRRWLGLETQATVHDWRVAIRPTAPHLDPAPLLARLARVLADVERQMPDHVAAARPHVSRVLVQRYPCRGAYFPSTRELMVELTFLADPVRRDAEIGATVVHEMEHARLRGTGAAEAMTSADEERACRIQEITYGTRTDGGDVVVARATEALALDDDGVAPTIDWEHAWRRTLHTDG